MGLQDLMKNLIAKHPGLTCTAVMGSGTLLLLSIFNYIHYHNRIEHSLGTEVYKIDNLLDHTSLHKSSIGGPSLSIYRYNTFGDNKSYYDSDGDFKVDRVTIGHRRDLNRKTDYATFPKVFDNVDIEFKEQYERLLPLLTKAETEPEYMELNK